MQIARLDHLVLTVADLDRTVAFYRDVLGMEPVVFAGDRTALNFGQSKINLHVAGQEFEPKAARPVPGSADLCLVVEGDLDDVRSRCGSDYPMSTPTKSLRFVGDGKGARR